ncbi:AbfB domain-containing protein [Streptomyces sp. NPDC051907]|uniref:AbfB domain-containing protein n=1 Tax=Streptomyces sp. NPDC051907 TaxID=3155284 RepID=UPI0034135A91
MATGVLAALGVAAPGPAVALPSVAAVAAADGIGTTEAQRVEAAAVVRLDPSPEVLLLNDYDYLHALWKKASEAGEELDAVRTAAEEAMASTSAEDHVRFIATGVHQAYKLDRQRERDRVEAERAVRLAKSQTLLAVGIPSSPDLLALSDDNFIRAVARHSAAGPEVRAAAIRAMAGDSAAWREFIVNGAREAHKRDVANELKELEEKDRKEAERRKELAARTNAAALFRITPSEAMLGLSDDNFIRELLRIAADDVRSTGLYAAGQQAVLTSDPAEWKQFIHTGADQAYKRDDEARRKKVAEGNRRLALQIQAAAQNDRVHPGLVAAAEKALAGSDEEVAEFLKEDNQYRARRQSLQLSEHEEFGWYARQSSADGGEGFAAPVDETSSQSDREDATWVIVPSLAGQPGCYSFESVRKPGYYLKADKRFQGLRVRISPDDRSVEFRQSATWCTQRGPLGGRTSFTWGGSNKLRLGHKKGYLYAGGFDDPEFTPEATFWLISSPLAR